jgi:hypothetical protein
MRHDYVEGLFKKHLPPEIYALVLDVLRTQYPSDIGYNPGSQLVQIAGISVLDGIDHFIKEQLRIKHYVRYMDDGILISHDKAELQNALKALRVELAKIGYEFNPNKTHIAPIKQGITFLGFKFRLTPTGKVLMQIPKSKLADKKRELKSRVGEARKRGKPRSFVDESYRDWRTHALKGNNHKVIYMMDKYYADLWKERAC